MAGERKKKEERTEKGQAFYDAVHFWFKHPYVEAWEEVKAKALIYKREKVKPDAEL